MYEAIKNFNKQFLFKPEIINSGVLVKKSSFIAIGMGGSLLAPKLLKAWKPSLDIITRTDYGLPELPVGELEKRLVILSSYSGNTEEPIDAFNKAKEKNLNMAVIATGGKLLSLAKENRVPYIELPATGIQPRSALGFSILAFLKFIGEEEELKKIGNLAMTLNPSDYEEDGKALAQKMINHIPVIYSSSRNVSVAYNWKIKLNETGKIPAFYNVFPELNHNEITGFDAQGSTKELSKNFYFIFLRDQEDNPRILKRMVVTEKLYKDRDFPVETIELKGDDTWHKIFSSLILADWTAYHTALAYGLEPEQVPIQEELKKLI